MQKIIFRLLFFVLVFTNNLTRAQGTPGYIVTNESDTIYGSVFIPLFNLYDGTFRINGIDLETFHYQVSFKAEKKMFYKTFKPEQIAGFSFYRKSQNYFFKSFDLQETGITKKERESKRFLNLVYKSNYALYRNIGRIYAPNLASYANGKTTGYHDQLFYDYYLFDEKIGIKKVTQTKETSEVRQLLEEYGFDREFTGTLSKHAKFRDIRKILYEYDKWLAEKRATTIET